MRNLIFILLILIPVGCFAQGEWTERQDFLSGAKMGDERSGASGIATIDSMVFTGVNTGVWSGGVKYNLLEGSLASPTTITGTEVNYLSIKMSDAGDRSAWFIFRPADGLSMRAYTGDDYTGDSSFVTVDSNLVSMGIYDGAAIKSITIDTTNIRGIEVRDDDAGVGLKYYADYSPVYVERSVTDYGYQGTHLGYQDLDATIYSPGLAQHGYVVVYDSSGYATDTDKYKLNDVVEVSSAAGMMVVVMDTIIFSSEVLTTVCLDLPEGTIVWDVQVFILTVFDGSGTNLLDVGITGDGDKFINDFDLENAATTFYGLGAIPYRMIATTSITFQYTDSGSDAAAGVALIYVKYSIH